jgi:hypothetical protein
MKNPYLRFEDGKITLNGKTIMVSSASLSIAPSLQEERVYGDLDLSIVGSKTEFVKYAATDGLKGSLSLSFYISAETFAQEGSPNSIDRLFDIKEGMSEKPIDNNEVGRYYFNNMYLKSFGFEMTPFSVIRASAEYDIYGTIRKNVGKRFRKGLVDFAHSLKSFGNLKVAGINSDSIAGGQFEASSLRYSIKVERKLNNNIRENENTYIFTNADGPVPGRVSVEKIESEMSVSGNEIVQNLNMFGDYQNLNTVEGIIDSEISAFLYGLNGEKLAKFSSKGKIQNQSISIQEGSLASSEITIKEIIK